MLALLLAAAGVSLAKAPPEAAAAFQRGRELIEGQRWDDARAELRRAAEGAPDFALALAYLGRVTQGAQGEALLLQAKGLEAGLPQSEALEIEELLAERRGQSEKARDYARQIAQLVPDDWHAQFRLGVAEVNQGRSQAALVALNRSIALNPKAAEAYNARGYVYAQRGEFDLALADLQKYVSLRPDEPNPLDSLGEVQLMAGQFAKAEESFARAVARSPRFWIAETGLAQARALAGNYDGARQAIRKARELTDTPHNRALTDAYAAWTWACEKNRDEALKVIDTMEKTQHDAFSLALAPLERAQILAVFGDAPRAVAQAELALTRAQNTALSGDERDSLRRRALATLIDASLQGAHPDRARQALSQLEAEARETPNDAELRSLLHLSRGRVDSARGDAKAALAEFARCDPEDWTCRLEEIRVLDATSPAQAGVKRDALLKANRRDGVYRGVDPVYLYARSVVMRKQDQKP